MWGRAPASRLQAVAKVKYLHPHRLQEQTLVQAIVPNLAFPSLFLAPLKRKQRRAQAMFSRYQHSKKSARSLRYTKILANQSPLLLNLLSHLNTSVLRPIYPKPAL